MSKMVKCIRYKDKDTGELIPYVNADRQMKKKLKKDLKISGKRLQKILREKRRDAKRIKEYEAARKSLINQ